MRRSTRLLTLILMLSLAAAVSAADDGAMLERVQAFLYERASEHGDEVVIEVNPPSARLSSCVHPRPFLPNSDAQLRSRVSVGVRCGEDGHQVRYLQAQIQVIGQYLEIASEVSRGEILDASHLIARRGNLTRLPKGTILSLEEAIGQQATRRLRPGLTLLEQHLRAPRLIERGDRVKLVATGSGFRVQRQAEAIDPGGVNDTVRVRLADRQIIEGRVTGKGRVGVDF